MRPIVREIEVDAARFKLWEVVSAIDEEPEYWHGTREVINKRREGNVTDRVVVQNFLGTRVEQRVTLKPEESVEVEYLRGTTVGTKRVEIRNAVDSHQLVKVTWEVHFTGLLMLLTPVIRNHIVRGTENALLRIKERAEGERPGTLLHE